MNKGRKISGGKYHALRKKKSYEHIGRVSTLLLGETKRKQIRTMGGTKKQILLSTNEANVKVGKQVKKATIANVIETPQNKFLARQNRLMKGVIVETSLGKARITNRPSREGVINAILVQES